MVDDFINDHGLEIPPQQAFYHRGSSYRYHSSNLFFRVGFWDFRTFIKLFFHPTADFWRFRKVVKKFEIQLQVFDLVAPYFGDADSVVPCEHNARTPDHSTFQHIVRFFSGLYGTLPLSTEFKLTPGLLTGCRCSFWCKSLSSFPRLPGLEPHCDCCSSAASPRGCAHNLRIPTAWERTITSSSNTT